ncbi:MAG TPA: hypothetical protein VMU47_23600 [Caldimonas sp.]|nr:hypothetical protein [Caldimonas sp.]
MLLVLPAALAQQTPAPFTPAATACTPDVCTITVRINGHCRSPGGMTVEPPVVAMRQPRIILRWWLADGAYEFNEDGVVFDEIAQFEHLPSPNYIREQRILDTRVKSGDFRYIVRVRGCPDVAAVIRHE